MASKQQDETIFRVRFYHEDKVYEIYARSLAHESILGFLEVEEIVFEENNTLVLDPNEERLKQEFEDVVCTYIPLQSVIRIDEVKKRGVAKVQEVPSTQANTTNILRPFPPHFYNRPKQGE